MILSRLFFNGFKIDSCYTSNIANDNRKDKSYWNFDKAVVHNVAFQAGLVQIFPILVIKETQFEGL